MKNLFPTRLPYAWVVLLSAFLPLAVQATTLADAPIALQAGTKPNILFTLDNSSSMRWGYSHSSVYGQRINGKVVINATRHCNKSSATNKMYYNPLITYLPGRDASGKFLPNANFNAALVSPYNPTRGYAKSGRKLTRYDNSPFFFHEELGDLSYGPVNLEKEFQAYFDHGAAINLRRITRTTEHFFDEPTAAYYYQYTGKDPAIPEPGKCYPDSSYTRVVVGKNSGPNGTDERTNFANWFSYHRTRFLTMQTALSIAFAGLDDNYRVGFATINNNDKYFVPIDDFGTSQREEWFKTLFTLYPGGGTPLIEATHRAGEYFRTGKMAEVEAKHPDPIRHSCQQNYHILSSDGAWEQPDSLYFGNRDRTVPNLPAPVPFDPVARAPLKTGQDFPRPFYEGSNASEGSLADGAMQYWITDLRPTMENNVVPNEQDPATWQHMTTYTIGLGVDGRLEKNDATFDKLSNGLLDWPVPEGFSATAIDDMWHAAVNGHGEYFSASDPKSLQAGVVAALADATGRASASAGVAVSNPDITASDNSVFVSGYHSGHWSGDLKAYPVDLKTGDVDFSKPLWKNSAQAQLDAETWNKRRIGSYSGQAGISFSPGSGGLSQAQLARLNSPFDRQGKTDHASVVAFLRGDRSKEGTLYRERRHLLGDIVNAASLFIGKPLAGYRDAGYVQFKNDHRDRKPMVYQGANDGMLHAFSAETGSEQWAYVPNRLIVQDYATPVATYPNTSTLVNLSLKSGFRHRYYVDGTPVQSDIDLNNTQGTTDNVPKWATLLVGGLNKGGRGYYALNVTKPEAASDAEVAAKAQWEFPNNGTPASQDRNVGFSYGRPIIVKTVAAGWVVLVTSGYDNGHATGGDGKGYLYVLNAGTGAVIRQIGTGAGTRDVPSGLAQISAYVENGDTDRTVDFVYGGDLEGNLWRFDLSSKKTRDWKAVRLATLVDANGKTQPITTAPELGRAQDKRLVLVGTGRYLDGSDVPGHSAAGPAALQRQSFYAIVDDQADKPLVDPVRTRLRQQTITVTEQDKSIATVTSNAVDLSVNPGWFVDLPHSSERSVTDPVLVGGIVAFTTNIPNVDACSPGGSSWLYVLDVKSGTTTTVPAGRSLGNSLASAVVPTRRTGTRSVDGIIVRSDGTTTTRRLVDLPPAAPPKRKMWREIMTR